MALAGSLLQQARAGAGPAALASATDGAHAEAASAGTAHAATAVAAQARQARAAQALRAAAAAQAAGPLASRQQTGHTGGSQLPESVLNLIESTGSRYQPAQPTAGKLCLHSDQFCLAELHAKTVTNRQEFCWAQLCVSCIGSVLQMAVKSCCLATACPSGIVLFRAGSLAGLAAMLPLPLPVPLPAPSGQQDPFEAEDRTESMQLSGKQYHSSFKAARSKACSQCNVAILRSAAASVLAPASGIRGPLLDVDLRHLPEMWSSPPSVP